MKRLIAVAVVAAVSGCQCFVPVEPFDGGQGGDGGQFVLDAGVDAGVDAGTDAGRDGGNDGGSDAGVECVTAASCTGPGLSQTFCPTGSDAGFSCINSRCVYECVRGRTCEVDAGPVCLTCAGAGASCTRPGCGAASRQAEVEGTTADCTLPFQSALLVPTGNCEYRLILADGGVVGRLAELSSFEVAGQIEGTGACVGQSLFTQVERWVMSCANGCQFVLRN